MLFIKDKSLAISAPREKTIYGVTVRKLPIAKYIKLLRTAEELPQILTGKMFPEKNISEIAEYLKTLDKNNLPDLLSRLLTAVPEEIMYLLSELLDISKERLTEDVPDALSPAELLEIISEFWELNDLSGFFATARRLAGRLKTANTGSSAG